MIANSLTRFIALILSFCLILEQSVFAQTIDLSRYFARNPAQAIPQSDKFRPLHLRYISYDNQANDFKILLDKGDFFNQKTEKPKNEKTSEFLNSQIPKLSNSDTPELEKATQELMKYFFIGLALPNEKFWVNLRPDSPDNILDPELEKTDIGRIFLEADLQLKKDTSGMTSPQTKEGREYWDKLYKKAGELFGSENITIPTITRPWIVPNEIIIRESPEGAYIYKATLKVMLEEDYLNQKTEKPKNPALPAGRQKTEIYNFSDPRLKELNEYSTQLIKETIIPKLTYEVNASKRYAPLRQVYYSLILAQWFKQKYSSSGITSASGTSASVNRYIDLIDSGSLANLTSSQPYDKQSYFQQYQQSFKDGEYNLQEPVYTPMGQSIRRYVSGGINGVMASSSLTVNSVDMMGLNENYLIPAAYSGAGIVSPGLKGEGYKNSSASSAVEGKERPNKENIFYSADDVVNMLREYFLKDHWVISDADLYPSLIPSRMEAMGIRNTQNERSVHIGSGNSILPFVDMLAGAGEVIVSDLVLDNMSYAKDKILPALLARLPHSFSGKVKFEQIDAKNIRAHPDFKDDNSVDHITVTNLFNDPGSDLWKLKDALRFFKNIFSLLKVGGTITVSEEMKEAIKIFREHYPEYVLNDPVYIGQGSYAIRFYVARLERKADSKVSSSVDGRNSANSAVENGDVQFEPARLGDSKRGRSLEIKVSVDEDILYIISELEKEGIYIGFAGGIARKMVTGIKPSLRAVDVDIVIRDYDKKKWSVNRIAHRVDDMARVKFRGIPLHILNLGKEEGEEDLFLYKDEPYAKVDALRDFSLNRLIVYKDKNGWVVTSNAGGDYAEDIISKRFSLIPALSVQGGGRSLKLDTIFRCVRLMLEFPDFSVDGRSKDEISKAVSEMDAESIKTIKEIIFNFLNNPKRSLHNIPENFLDMFARAKNPDAIIPLLKEIGGDRQTLYGILETLPIEKITKIVEENKPVNYKELLNLYDKDNMGVAAVANSPLLNENKGAPGGVDFAALSVQTQMMPGVSSALTANFQPLTSAQMEAEWNQIQAMVNAAIRPSPERLERYAVSVSSGLDYPQARDKLVGLLADILRNDETSQSQPRLEPALRNILLDLEGK